MKGAKFNTHMLHKTACAVVKFNITYILFFGITFDNFTLFSNIFIYFNLEDHSPVFVCRQNKSKINPKMFK